jgi:hypothetical protein
MHLKKHITVRQTRTISNLLLVCTLEAQNRLGCTLHIRVIRVHGLVLQKRGKRVHSQRILCCVEQVDALDEALDDLGFEGKKEGGEELSLNSR